MNHLKGFSLIEVLASLILIATIAFTLLDNQQNFKNIVQHLLIKQDLLPTFGLEKNLIQKTMPEL